MSKRKILYVVTAVKWFDKVNGNTYHSAQILKTETGEVFYVPFQYGYGSQYQQSALEKLVELGEISGDSYLYERENGYPIFWFEFNVPRKSDCTQHGRAM